MHRTAEGWQDAQLGLPSLPKCPSKSDDAIDIIDLVFKLIVLNLTRAKMKL